MVPCLHQSNVYIKKNLLVWRVEKCIPLVVGKTALAFVGRQTMPSHVSQYRPRTEIWGNPGLPFTMVPCLHQSNVYIKRKLQKWRVQKCSPLVGSKTALTSSGRQPTPSHVSWYTAEYGNLRKSGSTFHYGTMVAPKHCLFQKEAMCMESPKMLSSSRCKNRAGRQTTNLM